jgi:hypothetical protein
MKHPIKAGVVVKPQVSRNDEKYLGARGFHAGLSHLVLKLPPEGGGFDPPKWGQ